MHSDEMFEEDEDIKESDNPLYSSRFSVNYCKILVIAFVFLSLLAGRTRRISNSFPPSRDSTHASAYPESYVSAVIRAEHVQFPS